MVAQTTAYEKHKERAARRSAKMSKLGRDIGDIPAVRDPARRAAAERSYRAFCDSYFPACFTLPWSDDHLRLIDKLEQVVRHSQQLAVAMPRGSGKTSLCERGVLWALLTGQHRFVYLIGSTAEHANGMLQNLKTELSTNDLLLEDFPEICYPIRCLEGEARRCAGQLHHGMATRIGWLADQIILPTIPGSRASGALVRVGGITGNIRGAIHAQADGSSIRPTLAVVDDPQTDESARSPSQCASRIGTIKGAVAGLAGPGKRTAVLIPCTVIAPDDLADQLLNRETNPDFQGERFKLVYEYPSATKLWDRYAELRAQALRHDGNIEAATAFYAAHREAMDEGAIAAWAARYDPKTELSAIQHAMNLRLKDAAAFEAEYQNEPQKPKALTNAIKIDDVIIKAFGPERGVVPLDATHLTAFIDVSQNLLWYIVAAWGEGFTGHVVDFGTWPDQKGAAHFTQLNARYTISTETPGQAFESQLMHALRTLTDDLLGRVWKREDDTDMTIRRCLIDAGWGDSTDVIRAVCRQSGHKAILLPSFGRGITADRRAMSDYTRKPGEQHGHNWYIPANPKGRHLIFDSNAWKTFINLRLRQPLGEQGSLTIFQGPATTTRLLAEHIAAEYPVATSGQGRVVNVFKTIPGRDNHGLDCLVGAAVAASEQGLVTIGHDNESMPRRRRRRKLDVKF